MWSYSSKLLKSFSGLSRSLSNPVWRRLVNWKIASNKPTRRGCRAGSKKVRSIKSIISSRTEGKFYSVGQSSRTITTEFVHYKQETQSSVTSVLSLPYCMTGAYKGVNVKNLVYIKCRKPNINSEQRVSLQFFPSLMLTNIMSLAPKVDKINSFVMHADLDLLRPCHTVQFSWQLATQFYS